MSSVYALVSSGDITKIRYVGISRYNDPSVRLSAHLDNSINEKYVGYDWPVYRWIRKHQDAGNIISCITLAFDISWEDACALEISKIKEFRELGYDLLNSTNGGEGVLGFLHNETTKEKMSISAKNRHRALKERGLIWGKDVGPQDKTSDDIKNKIISMRSDGYSYHSIAKEFNELNIPTQRGKAWYPSTIKNIYDRCLK
jgi:hypothetical protein